MIVENSKFIKGNWWSKILRQAVKIKSKNFRNQIGKVFCSTLENKQILLLGGRFSFRLLPVELFTTTTTGLVCDIIAFFGLY